MQRILHQMSSSQSRREELLFGFNDALKNQYQHNGLIQLKIAGKYCPDRQYFPAIHILMLRAKLNLLVKKKVKIKVEWQFTIPQTREKLSRHFEDIKSKN